jgi:hypothetical protein
MTNNYAIQPISDVEEEPETLILQRGFTVRRLRDSQPAINAPAQDTLPGSSSGEA